MIIIYNIKIHSNNQNIHINNTKTIYKFNKIKQTIQKFYNKNFFHKNKQPNFLNIKIQKIIKPIQQIKTLQIIKNNKTNLQHLTQKYNITKQTLNQKITYIKNKTIYTKTIILSTISNKHLNSFKQKKIKTTHFSFKNINNKNDLNKKITNTLTITNYINTHPYIKKKLYISNNLTYTTNYFTSTKINYHQLFNIKPINTKYKNKIIFINNHINLNHYISFLKNTPKQIIYKTI